MATSATNDGGSLVAAVIRDCLSLAAPEDDGRAAPAWMIRDERGKWEAEVQAQTLYAILLGEEAAVKAEGDLYRSGGDIWGKAGLKPVTKPPGGCTEATWLDDELLETSTVVDGSDIAGGTSTDATSETVSWPPPQLYHSRSNSSTSTASSRLSGHSRRSSASEYSNICDADIGRVLNRTMVFNEIWSVLVRGRRLKMPRFAEDLPNFLFERAGTTRE